MVLVIFDDYDKFFKVANSDLRKLNKNLHKKSPLDYFTGANIFLKGLKSFRKKYIRENFRQCLTDVISESLKMIQKV